MSHHASGDNTEVTYFNDGLRTAKPETVLVSGVEIVGQFGGTILDFGIVDQDLSTADPGNMLPYIDGPGLPPGYKKVTLPATIHIAGDTPLTEYYPFVTMKLPSGQDRMCIGGFRIRYRVGRQSYTLLAAYSYVLCAPDLSVKCTPTH